MAKVQCPHCASPAVSVSLIDGYKFYCSRCGWNLEIAKSALSLTVKISLALVIIGLLLAVIARVRSPIGDWAAAATVLALSCLPLFFALSAFYQIRKLRNLSVSSATQMDSTLTVSEIRSSSDVPANAIAFKEKEFPELAILPRPRRLKMSWKGRIYVYGLPATWSGFNNSQSVHGRHWSFLLVPAVIYGYTVAFFRNRFRERRLLASGELASGYVTAQDNGRYTQTIQYCFKVVPSGKLATGRCTDASRSLYEGMTVPIFYDADNPAHSIPLDCSLTKISRA